MCCALWRHLSFLPYQFSIFKDVGGWQPCLLETQCFIRYSTITREVAVQFILIIISCNKAFLFAIEHEKLLLNDKITVSFQTKMFPKCYIKRYKQQQRTLRYCKANKFSKTTIAIRFNLKSSSLSIRASFCICCIIYTSFCYLSVFFLCLTRVCGVSHCLNFDKFRDTTPLSL